MNRFAASSRFVPSFAVKLAAFAIVLIAAFSSTAGARADDPATGSAGSVEVGALLPLTGALSSYGETSQAAIQDAVVTLDGQGLSVAVDYEDTNSDPAVALTKLKSLQARGVRVVIGPYSSSEVKAVLDYANAQGMLLLSPLSTARSLAIPDDNLLRFTPDDEQEGAAMAALAWADGVRTILPISRNDEGNLGLQTAMKAAYEKLGGKLLTPIVYAANQTSFGDVSAAAANAVSGSSGKTGIYLTAFDEVTSLFNATRSQPSLLSVAWYGSDSVAQSKGLVADKLAAAFADAASYPNPILGLPDSTASRWQPISDRLAQKLHRQPDAFAMAAVDALTVASKAMHNLGANAQTVPLRDEMVRIAKDYIGLTGATVLNPAGDRALGNYDFWSVCSVDGAYVWSKTGSFAGSGEVKHTGC